MSTNRPVRLDHPPICGNITTCKAGSKQPCYYCNCVFISFLWYWGFKRCHCAHFILLNFFFYLSYSFLRCCVGLACFVFFVMVLLGYRISTILLMMCVITRTFFILAALDLLIFSLYSSLFNFSFHQETLLLLDLVFSGLFVGISNTVLL